MSSVIATYLTIAAMLALTTFPVLIPVIITTGHGIRRRISAQARAVERRGREIGGDRLDVELALLACHWYGAAVLQQKTR